MGAAPPRACRLADPMVTLQPTGVADAGPLLSALDDPEVWRWLSIARPATPAEMERLVAGALAERDAGLRWPWTIRLHDGTVVGWTSFLDIQPANEAIEIGFTSVGRPWWRTAVNTHTKLLLLTHLFEDLGYGRVCLKTDVNNLRSQQAIARLGATREGVLRRVQRRPDGSWRDSVYFSLLVDEWPAAKRRLLDPPAPADARVPSNRR